MLCLKKSKINIIGLLDDESILMVSTGSDGFGAISDTDAFAILSPKRQNMTSPGTLSKCQHTSEQLRSPITLYMATGQLMKFADNFHTPLICGGIMQDDGANRQCYQMLNSFLPVGGTMTSTRIGAASVVLNAGTTIWITGGYDQYDIDLDTTEWTDVSLMAQSGLEGMLQEGTSLPKALAFHCLEMIDNDMTILYGGEYLDPYVGLGLVQDSWIMSGLNNHRNGQWIPGPPMWLARSLHGCGVVKRGTNNKVVVAAGGISKAHETATDKVEFLEVDSDGNAFSSWYLGPQLPISLYAASSASTDDQSSLFLAGGRISYATGEPSFSIFCLQCELSTYCQWTKSNEELPFTRAYSVAMLLPPGGLLTGLVCNG